MREFDYDSLPFSLMAHQVQFEQDEEIFARIDIYNVVGLEEKPVLVNLTELLRYGYFIYRMREDGALLLHKVISIKRRPHDDVRLTEISPEDLVI